MALYLDAVAALARAIEALAEASAAIEALPPEKLPAEARIALERIARRAENSAAMHELDRRAMVGIADRNASEL